MRHRLGQLWFADHDASVSAMVRWLAKWDRVLAPTFVTITLKDISLLFFLLSIHIFPVSLLLLFHCRPWAICSIEVLGCALESHDDLSASKSLGIAPRHNAINRNLSYPIASGGEAARHDDDHMGTWYTHLYICMSTGNIEQSIS